MRGFFLGSLWLLISAGVAAAEPEELPLCIGFNPQTQKWGLLAVGVAQHESNCAAGYALLSHDVITGPERPADQQAPSGSCCPLPEGSLTEEHIFRPVVCPDTYVATGARVAPSSPPPTWTDFFSAKYELRCTKINPEKFYLDEPKDAMIVEYTEDLRNFRNRIFGVVPPKRTHWEMLPPYLRYGIGRFSRSEWRGAGCVGYPWGSVLTEIGERDCRGFKFRRLVRKAGEANTATPQPPCRGVRKIFSPDAECVR